jgi:hypothetical protein
MGGAPGPKTPLGAQAWPPLTRAPFHGLLLRLLTRKLDAQVMMFRGAPHSRSHTVGEPHAQRKERAGERIKRERERKRESEEKERKTEQPRERTELRKRARGGKELFSLPPRARR